MGNHEKLIKLGIERISYS